MRAAAPGVRGFVRKSMGGSCVPWGQFSQWKSRRGSSWGLRQTCGEDRAFRPRSRGPPEGTPGYSIVRAALLLLPRLESLALQPALLGAAGGAGLPPGAGDEGEGLEPLSQPLERRAAVLQLAAA